MNKFIAIARRAKDVLRKEGFIPLLRLGFIFLVGIFFQKFRTYYIYEYTLKYTLKERNEADFIPRIQDFVFHIVSTNQQADKLAADGLDIVSKTTNCRQRFEKGAIAFCFFVEGELAHIGWVAMTKEAKNSFDGTPYKVDFSNSEACTGGTVTFPKYLGNGLMTYSYFKRLQYLKDMGITVVRCAVETSNISSQKAHAKFSPKIYAKGRYLRVLRRKFFLRYNH